MFNSTTFNSILFNGSITFIIVIGQNKYVFVNITKGKLKVNVIGQELKTDINKQKLEVFLIKS